jgi:hypothetical protein
MADWPELTEFAQVVNVDNVDDWETTLTRVLAAAIAKVKLDVGSWDEDEDEPDESLAQAALRMAELLAERPNATTTLAARDITYQRLLYGHRRTGSFGVA